jgi:glycosyltransferase involved in cell wall biosynthesis
MLEAQAHPLLSNPAGAGDKVAIVCHSHPSISKGGAEVAAYALYCGLRELNVDVIFIAACEYGDRNRLALASDDEYAVYYDQERYDHFYHLAAPGVEGQLLRILREQRVTVVNFHHFLMIGLNSLRAVRALKGVRCYYTIHEFLGICHNHGQMITREAQLLCARATNEACVSCFPQHLRTQFTQRKETMLDAMGAFDGFIAPSHFLADRFIQWGLPADQVSVIENGLLKLAALPSRKRIGGSWTFGYFGQINPYKGVDVLLDAADLIAADPELAARVRLRIHGNFVGQSSAFLERFKEATRDLPFLCYMGPYNSAAVYELMSECDYVVVPSKWWENSPVVIQEAYAVRVPIICTGIGGLAEKVREGVSGLHFARGDAPDLVRALRIAADSKVADSLKLGIPAVSSAAEMGRNYLKFFSSDRRAVKTLPRIVDRAR